MPWSQHYLTSDDGRLEHGVHAACIAQPRGLRALSQTAHQCRTSRRTRITKQDHGIHLGSVQNKTHHLSSVLMVVFQVSLGQPVSLFFHLFWMRGSGNKWHRFSWVGCPSCHPTNSVGCKTEGAADLQKTCSEYQWLSYWGTCHPAVTPEKVVKRYIHSS